MSVTELLPDLQKLSRADKFRVMQFLVSDLSKEEEMSILSGRPMTVMKRLIS
jgi:hypothetical protein